MKLFIWINPYPVSYGGSYLHVVAESEAEARNLIEKPVPRFMYGDFPKGELFFTENLGPPTRVLDLPCAEVIEWSE